MALCDWSRESRDRTTSTCSTCYKTVGTNNNHFNLKWLYYFCSFLTPKRKKKSYLYFSIFHRTLCFPLNVTHLVVGKIERQVKSNDLYSVANPRHSDRAISSIHKFDINSILGRIWNRRNKKGRISSFILSKSAEAQFIPGTCLLQCK